VIVLRPVGDVVLGEVRNVVTPEPDEPALLELVKPLDHAGAPHVHRPEALFLVVVRVRRPTVVEGILGLGHDLADRRLDRGRAPRLVDERLVVLGIEERQR
jgi:hypothetical protein